LRTAFLGTSDFAAGVLDALAASAHRPALVITRPDRPRGRGRRTMPPPVAVYARERGLRAEQPPSVNSDETLAKLDELAPDAVIICAFGALVKEPLLSHHPMLNVHPSLLPRWRGAAPIERAIMAGDTETGVCVMRLTAGLDSGPVCARASEPIAADDDYGALARRLCALGGKLIVQTLDAVAGGTPLPFEEQGECGVSYAEKITAADRILRPERGAAELARTVRALRPHIGASIELSDGSRLGICDAIALSDPIGGAASERGGTNGREGAPVREGATGRERAPVREAASIHLAAGRLAAVEGRLLLGTSDGVLELLQVQPAGGRPMDAGAYLRGHAL
jgi:methionyl-tRNA formyltransferase